MMPDQTPRRFTNDEVNAILQRALAQQGGGNATGLTYDDLLETARELGIDPSQVEAALSEHERESEIEAARAAWRVRRKKKFFEHLRSYVIVNVALILISVMSDSGGWFVWPLLGWGIGLMFDASDTFFPKERSIERGARRILAREKNVRQKGVKVASKGGKSLTIDGKAGKIIIEKGGKRIEIG